MKPTDVLVDVYSWVKAAEETGRVPINGLFRHADKLSRLFTPAAILPDPQNACNAGLERINRHLERSVTVFKSSSDVNASDFGVWLSLGVDQLDPIELAYIRLKRATILHDMMAAEGVFGNHNQALFFEGARLNEIFLAVSDTTAQAFCAFGEKHRMPFPRELISYGAPHNFTAKDISDRDGLLENCRSLSVHTLFKYKNFFKALSLARHYSMDHTHVGVLGDEATKDLDRWADFHPFTWFNGASDAELKRLYSIANLFICMSSNEGFSMPPMEAIIFGVPFVLLSDIPVHREVYGRCGVNFVSLNNSQPLLDFKHLSNTTQEDRWDLYERYSFDRLINPFLYYLAKL